VRLLFFLCFVAWSGNRLELGFCFCLDMDFGGKWTGLFTGLNTCLRVWWLMWEYALFRVVERVFFNGG
jgi:hypothetical protein